MTRPLLSVIDLTVTFDTPRDPVEAVRGISFDVAAGEFVGVIGESGCGKSVMARALLGLVDPPGRIAAGRVEFAGTDLLSLNERAMRAYRGSRVSMIFQDPMTSLNPAFTVGQQLEMVMRAHGTKRGRTRAEELLGDVEIPRAAARLRQYPHELSGGMRQRVMIAMALANSPELIIADEPTTALDVTVQAQILDLLLRFNRERGTALILISHNLGVVAQVAHRVVVVYAGKVVEQGPTREVFSSPRHPYTSALLHAMPRDDGAPLQLLSGAPPSLSPAPVSCAFAPRCSLRHDRCDDDPELEAFDGGRREVACWSERERRVRAAG